MSSALRKTGSTARWRRLRKYWEQQLPLPCPYCPELVHGWQPWDLDHAVARAAGGTDMDVRPAHRSCNRRQGFRVAAERQRAAADVPVHSRNW